jgi:hypothetical protein
VCHLPAAKNDRHLHLVLVLQELYGALDLKVDIMLAGFGTQPDLFGLDLVRVVPKSMIRQTGGFSLGATSTKSKPTLRARSMASEVIRIPNCSPFSEMTRTGDTRICSLTLFLMGSIAIALSC